MPSLRIRWNSRIVIGLLFVMMIVSGMFLWWDRSELLDQIEELRVSNSALNHELDRVKKSTIRRFRASALTDRSIDSSQLSLVADHVFADQPTRPAGADIWRAIRAKHPEASLTTYYFHITDSDDIADRPTPLDFYVVSSHREVIGVGQEQPVAGLPDSDPFAVVYDDGKWDLQILKSKSTRR